jgi:hypothetical protein
MREWARGKQRPANAERVQFRNSLTDEDRIQIEERIQQLVDDNPVLSSTAPRILDSKTEPPLWILIDMSADTIMAVTPMKEARESLGQHQSQGDYGPRRLSWLPVKSGAGNGGRWSRHGMTTSRAVLVIATGQAGRHSRPPRRREKRAPVISCSTVSPAKRFTRRHTHVHTQGSRHHRGSKDIEK